EVLVPESVYKEVTIGDKPQATRLSDYLKDKVRKVDMQGYVYLDAYADAGETEAMLLYKQISADRLLIDDKRGRKVAKINNITVIGSLGVLLAAKKAGIISEVASSIDRISKSAVYLDQTLVVAVLEIAGESYGGREIESDV
ncbi:MAG TPA: DUF3368 domain-containing protein, partial [Bacteroidetes bacterium]|nr:DUF3368 domain-containing protein [Bacteroidota bacterium]